jgi:hypothetical protein
LPGGSEITYADMSAPRHNEDVLRDQSRWVRELRICAISVPKYLSAGHAFLTQKYALFSADVSNAASMMDDFIEEVRQRWIGHIR